MAVPLVLNIGLSIAANVVDLLAGGINQTVSLVILEALAICAPTAAFLLIAGGDRRRFGAISPKWTAILAAAICGLGTGILGYGLGVAIDALLPESVRDWISRYWALDLQAGRTWELVLLLVGFAGVGPIFEELLFRGLIQHRLAKFLPIRTAILVNALIFAAFHLNPFLFIQLFGLGYLFTYLAVRGGSVWLAAAAHAAHNCSTILALNLELMTWESIDFLLLHIIAGICLFTAGLTFSYLIIKAR